MNNPVMMVAAILLPVLGSIPVMFFPFKKRSHMAVYLEAVVLVTSCLVWGIIAEGPRRQFRW